MNYVCPVCAKHPFPQSLSEFTAQQFLQVWAPAVHSPPVLFSSHPRKRVHVQPQAPGEDTAPIHMPAMHTPLGFFPLKAQGGVPPPDTRCQFHSSQKPCDQAPGEKLVGWNILKQKSQWPPRDRRTRQERHADEQAVSQVCPMERCVWLHERHCPGVWGKFSRTDTDHGSSAPE